MVGRRTAGGRHQDGSGLASVRLGGPKLKIVGGNGGSFSRKKKKSTPPQPPPVPTQGYY